MKQLPVGWSTKKLSELLTDKQIKVVMKILNNNSDHSACVSKLKEFLRTVKLEDKGVVPEYLAYYLKYAFDERQFT